MRVLRTVAVVGGLALLVAACGSTSGGGTSPGSDTIAGVPETSTPAADSTTGGTVAGPEDEGAEGLAVVPGAFEGKSPKYRMTSVVSPSSAEGGALGDGAQKMNPGIVGGTAGDSPSGSE